MNNSLIFETLLILFAILASNGFIYSLTFFDLNQKNFTQPTNISYLWNFGSLLMASTPINITLSESESTTSQSSTLSESSLSQSSTLSESSLSQSSTLYESSLSQDIFDNNLIDLDINEEMTALSQNRLVIDATGDIIFSNDDTVESFKPLDSQTILNSQTFEEWREIAMDLHDLPYNTPQGIVQQVKFEELNILYSQDIINFSITQTELRHIIELIPTIDLFKPDINHLILTIMSHYHL